MWLLRLGTLASNRGQLRNSQKGRGTSSVRWYHCDVHNFCTERPSGVATLLREATERIMMQSSIVILKGSSISALHCLRCQPTLLRRQGYVKVAEGSTGIL